jgi:chemotaxis protein methyltransferase CheR
MEIPDREIDELLADIRQRSGYDFRGYVRTTLRRRLQKILTAEQLPDVCRLREKLGEDPTLLGRMMPLLSISVTEMFRDPEFFLALRLKLRGLLDSYPFIRVWHAGCSSGEEVYSMAILLEEEGLFSRARIYGTDMSPESLKRAREAVIPADKLVGYEENYRAAGGNGSLSDYFTVRYEHGLLAPRLRERLIFASHNLTNDQSFNEFHMIVCRNVLIYFERQMQERVHRLLYESLRVFGILALGTKETLRLSPHHLDYEPLDSGQKIYRRLR